MLLTLPGVARAMIAATVAAMKGETYMPRYYNVSGLNEKAVTQWAKKTAAEGGRGFMVKRYAGESWAWAADGFALLRLPMIAAVWTVLAPPAEGEYIGYEKNRLANPERRDGATNGPDFLQLLRQFSDASSRPLEPTGHLIELANGACARVFEFADDEGGIVILQKYLIDLVATSADELHGTRWRGSGRDKPIVLDAVSARNEKGEPSGYEPVAVFMPVLMPTPTFPRLLPRQHPVEQLRTEIDNGHATVEEAGYLLRAFHRNTPSQTQTPAEAPTAGRDPQHSCDIEDDEQAEAALSEIETMVRDDEDDLALEIGRAIGQPLPDDPEIELGFHLPPAIEAAMKREAHDEEIVNGCSSCGQSGHTTYTCPSNNEVPGGMQRVAELVNRETVLCEACHEVGHSKEQCPHEADTDEEEADTFGLCEHCRADGDLYLRGPEEDPGFYCRECADRYDSDRLNLVTAQQNGTLAPLPQLDQEITEADITAIAEAQMQAALASFR